MNEGMRWLLPGRFAIDGLSGVMGSLPQGRLLKWITNTQAPSDQLAVVQSCRLSQGERRRLRPIGADTGALQSPQLKINILPDEKGLLFLFKLAQGRKKYIKSNIDVGFFFFFFKCPLENKY